MEFKIITIIKQNQQQKSNFKLNNQNVLYFIQKINYLELIY